MTDRGPDAFVLIHQPRDGSDQYGLGPFPPVDGLAEEMLDNPSCDCNLTILWIGFPKGIRMAIGVDIEIDPDEIAEIVGEVLHDIIRTRKEAPNDRLN